MYHIAADTELREIGSYWNVFGVHEVQVCRLISHELHRCRDIFSQAQNGYGYGTAESSLAVATTGLSITAGCSDARRPAALLRLYLSADCHRGRLERDPVKDADVLLPLLSAGSCRDLLRSARYAYCCEYIGSVYRPQRAAGTAPGKLAPAPGLCLSRSCGAACQNGRHSGDLSRLAGRRARYSAAAILCVMSRLALPRRPCGGQSGRPLLAYRCQRRPPAPDKWTAALQARHTLNNSRPMIANILFSRRICGYNAQTGLKGF